MSNSDLSVLGTHQRRCRIRAEWLGLIHSIAQYLFRRTTNPLSTKPWTMVLWPRSCVIFQIRLANWPEKVASTVCSCIRLLTRDQPRWAPNLFDWSTLNEDFLFTFYSVCQNPLLTILPLTWFRTVPPGLLNGTQPRLPYILNRLSLSPLVALLLPPRLESVDISDKDFQFAHHFIGYLSAYAHWYLSNFHIPLLCFIRLYVGIPFPTYTILVQLPHSLMLTCSLILAR